jgi:hypothetical protein
MYVDGLIRTEQRSRVQNGSRRAWRITAGEFEARIGGDPDVLDEEVKEDLGTP